MNASWRNRGEAWLIMKCCEIHGEMWKVAEPAGRSHKKKCNALQLPSLCLQRRAQLRPIAHSRATVLHGSTLQYKHEARAQPKLPTELSNCLICGEIRGEMWGIAQRRQALPAEYTAAPGFSASAAELGRTVRTTSGPQCAAAQSLLQQC